MADSEVKARRKLEEAEKKCRGGGGFLGKIFGGSNGDEAADLFVQGCSSENCDDVDQNGAKNTLSSDDEASVECDLCGRDFHDVVSFELHYKTAHSHECSACLKKFLSQKALYVHSDEAHCPFYRLRVEKNPGGHHFQCYGVDCEKTFTTGKDRDQHCREEHNIGSVEITIERRKLARRVHEIEQSLTRTSLSPKMKQNVPRAIRFGDQERCFVGVQQPRSTRIRRFGAQSV